MSRSSALDWLEDSETPTFRGFVAAAWYQVCDAANRSAEENGSAFFFVEQIAGIDYDEAYLQPDQESETS